MTMLRSVTAGAVAAAMLATSAVPAMAQGYPGGYGSYGRPTYGPGPGYNGYRNHGRRDDTGAIVAGVIGVGILAAILASSSKSSQNNAYNNGYGSIRSDNDAADACAAAAERQFGNNARTRSIDSVDQVNNGGFDVRGSIGNAYASSYGNDARSFSCIVRQGAVQHVAFGGYGYDY